MSPLIAPSILSANFAELKRDINAVVNAKADWIHIDVMDGSFVPNITIGPVVVKAIRPHCSLPFDVHLMIERPENYIETFAEAGANIITVHAEACTHLHRVISQIHDCGIKAGVALNPHTPLSCVENILDDINLLLIMTVNPGFGGQTFINSMTNKISDAKQLIKTSKKEIYLEVDGGIHIDTGHVAVDAGADVLVAGNAIFGSDDIERTIRNLKNL